MISNMKITLAFCCFLVTTSISIDRVIAEDSIKTASRFLQDNPVLRDYPEAPENFSAIHSQIAQHADPESKFGFIVFSMARHGEKLLNETQREQLDALIEKRSSATLNWHDVRNMVRVKTQIAMWDYAEEIDADSAAKKKAIWGAWADLRVAYMEQEFFDKEQFQRAAWNILTDANRQNLRSGKWDKFMKRSTGHSRLFSADKQISRVLGKPDRLDEFTATEVKWKKQWDVMSETYEAESLFERKREFAMDLADEDFSITSWRNSYTPAFREFAEHECDAIRELLQSGYEIDKVAQGKLNAFREKLSTDAATKYAKAPEEMKALFP